MTQNNLAKAITYRYTRTKNDGTKENWNDIVDRCISGIKCLDSSKNNPVITREQLAIMEDYMQKKLALPSGRWLWVGGTEWIKNPENYPGAYNCSSIHFRDLEAFQQLAEVCLCGCGIGYVLSKDNISQLPAVATTLKLKVQGKFGDVEKESRLENTHFYYDGTSSLIVVGDSRKGWAEAYYKLIKLAFSQRPRCSVTIDISNLRPKGEAIHGFGGVANPDYLPTMFINVAAHLNEAIGRQLTSIEITKILGEMALAVERGAIRRSASIAQFDNDDLDSLDAKLNLWKKDGDEWKIDPLDMSLTMANHTRMFKTKPTYQEIKESIDKQYSTGEGAIMYVPEAIARGNADILPRDSEEKKTFLKLYCQNPDNGPEILNTIAASQGVEISDENAKYRASIYGVNPCGEIPMSGNLCNLSEVTVGLLDPFDFDQHKKAFQSCALFAGALLHHEFTSHPRYQEGRNNDPIVAVSITGVFDFFIKLLGDDYLNWTLDNRELFWNKAENTDRLVELAEKLNISTDMSHGSFYVEVEKYYYTMWRNIVEKAVLDYCQKSNLKAPNRCTTIQPSGTKSLLTNSSPGIHPTWGAYFVRRIRFAAEDPVARACIKAGHSTVKSQNDIANNTDSEVIIEFPMKAKWVDYVDFGKFPDIKSWPALGMFRFYMNAQKYYVGHNASCTINFGDDEIKELSAEIFKTIKEDEGYVSVALLPKSDIPFPNLPFENISRERYNEMISKIGEFDEEFVRKSDWNKNEKYQLACEGQMCQV